MTSSLLFMLATAGALGAVVSAALTVARRAASEPEVQLHRLRHELRTPLASVTALTAALDGGSGLDGDARRELARLAHWQAQHMADLVEGSEAARRKPGHRPLAEVVTAATVAAGLPRTRLCLALGPDVAALPVCRRPVQQIVTNLVENAVRHGPADGPVRVAACLDGDVLVLRVADDGHPTPALRRALDGRSTGLGLDIVRSLLAEAGGSLRLDPGSGGVVLEARLPGYGRATAGGALAD
jgi:two-component system OmpR family sensor kinase